VPVVSAGNVSDFFSQVFAELIVYSFGIVLLLDPFPRPAQKVPVTDDLTKKDKVTLVPPDAPNPKCAIF